MERWLAPLFTTKSGNKYPCLIIHQSARMAKTKGKKTILNGGYDKTKTLKYYWLKYKMLQLWKIVWQFLGKLTVCVP